MKLLIAIPALNEEGSIESIIQRSLDARDYIIRNSPVTDVEITVVSDGSTDRTVELASQYRDRIDLIVFPKNRGYGAAIKEAWKSSNAELVGFLDADGTCDPCFFADLCRELAQKSADVALGCRLNSQSQMPLIRRVGNFIFAVLLSAFSSSRVRDTASGMRVVRRSSLNHLFPLPDGLHFTPAMSARAILSDVLKIVEINMPYRERVGESKLRVGKDGLRFLGVIVEAAFLYQPGRPLALLAGVLFLAASLLMISPTLYYLQNFRVLDWMIYRFLVASLAGTGACLLFCASVLSRRMTRIALEEETHFATQPWAERFFRSRWFWTVPTSLVAIGSALIFGSVLERLETGHTYEHWSRYVVASSAYSVSIILAVTRGIDFVLDLVEERVAYRKLIGAAPAIPKESSPATEAFVYRVKARA